MKSGDYRARVNFNRDLYPAICADLDTVRRGRGRLIEMYAEKWAQFRHILECHPEVAASLRSAAKPVASVPADAKRLARQQALDAAGDFDVG